MLEGKDVIMDRVKKGRSGGNFKDKGLQQFKPIYLHPTEMETLQLNQITCDASLPSFSA